METYLTDCLLHLRKHSNCNLLPAHVWASLLTMQLLTCLSQYFISYHRSNANLNYLWRKERVRDPGAELGWNKNGGTYAFDRIFNGICSGEGVGVADRMTLKAPSTWCYDYRYHLWSTDRTDVIYRSRRLRGDTVRNSALRPQKQRKCVGNLRHDARTIATANSGHGVAHWKHFLQEAVWEHSGLTALASNVYCTR